MGFGFVKYKIALKKEGNYKECCKSPPLTKGDLGGFQNLQTEGIYGKRYNRPFRLSPFRFDAEKILVELKAASFLFGV
jgi:hypothetical protein